MKLPQVSSPFCMTLLLLVLLTPLASGSEYLGSLENVVEHHSMSVVLDGRLKYDNIRHGYPPQQFHLTDPPEIFMIVIILTEDNSESNTYFTRIFGNGVALNSTEQTSPSIHQWKVENFKNGFTVRYGCAPWGAYNSGIQMFSTWFPAFIIMSPEEVLEDQKREFHKRRAANYNGAIVNSWDADTTFKLVTEKYVIRSLRYGEIALFSIETALSSESWNVHFDVTRVNVSAAWMRWPFHLDRDISGYLLDVSENVTKIILPRGVIHYFVDTPRLASISQETYDSRLFNDLQNCTQLFARQPTEYGEHKDFGQKETISDGRISNTFIPMAHGKIKSDNKFHTRHK